MARVKYSVPLNRTAYLSEYSCVYIIIVRLGKGLRLVFQDFHKHKTKSETQHCHLLEFLQVQRNLIESELLDLQKHTIRTIFIQTTLAI